MLKRILMVLIVGVLSACVSGTKPSDAYIGKDGSKTLIESDAEMCRRSCNAEYSRCMDTRAAGTDTGGVKGPSGVFGASGDCRNALQRCIKGCK